MEIAREVGVDKLDEAPAAESEAIPREEIIPGVPAEEMCEIAEEAEEAS
jgi:hypothetical protein